MPLADIRRSARCLFLLFFFFLHPAWARPTPQAAEETSPSLVAGPSEALTTAARLGLRDLTVVHVDARDDLWPAPTPEQVEKARRLLDAGRFDAFDEAGRLFARESRRLYGMRNVLAMGHRLGIVREVYWVIPTTEAPDPKMLENLANFLNGRSLPSSDAPNADLKIAGSCLKGTISGVPVVIGRLSDFPATASPLWLDIDLSFFPELYKNPVASSYVGLLASFVDALEKRHPHPSLTTISYGEIDIGNRHLGPMLARLLAEPNLLEKAPPQSWTKREDAAYQEFFQQFEEASRTYAALLESQPDDPDLHYSLAMAQLQTGDEKNARSHLARAADLDPAYILGYMSAAAFFEKKKRPELAEKFLKSARERAPDNPLILETLADYTFTLGRPAEAAELYRRIIDLDHATALTHAKLGESLFQAERYAEAARAYRRAIELRRERREAPLPFSVWLHLGEALEKQGRGDKALETYREALRLYPELPTQVGSELKRRIENLRDRKKE